MTEDQVAELLANARIVLLEPDELLVVQVSREVTHEFAQALVNAFGPRRIIVTAPGIDLIGVRRLDEDGNL